MGLRDHAPWLGLLLHKLGAVPMLLAFGWAGWLLLLQRSPGTQRSRD